VAESAGATELENGADNVLGSQQHGQQGHCRDTPCGFLVKRLNISGSERPQREQGNLSCQEPGNWAGDVLGPNSKTGDSNSGTRMPMRRKCG
jgi:hypothetical protein